MKPVDRILVLGLLLTGVAGCPPRPPMLPPITDDVPMHVVIARVNRNAEAMDFLLRGGGVTATGRIADSSGRREAIDATGTLFFQRPRSLYLELKHSLAGKIEIGSNDEEFWYWEQFDHPRYFTGRHDLVAAGSDVDIPLRPDYLLDLLGLSDLPKETNGPNGPTFIVGPEVYNINFFDRDETGQLYHTKTMAVDRREPYLIRSICYYRPDGHPQMLASLNGYRQVEGTCVQVPAEIDIQSLENESRLKLEFTRIERSDNPRVVELRIARSPFARGLDVGEVIRLDRAPR